LHIHTFGASMIVGLILDGADVKLGVSY